MSERPEYNSAKLAELIVYIASRCEQMERFGSVKLNKILFWADFLAHESRGKPITGAVYQRLPNGPAPQQLLPVRSRLEESKALAMQERPAGPHIEKRPIALRAANLKLFEAEEIQYVDMAISALANHTAARASADSHRFVGWALARDGEEIPYFTVVLTSGPVELTLGEMQWAKEEVRSAA